MKITYDGNIYDFEKGITLLEISKKFKDKYKFDIIIAKVNNQMVELNKEIYEDCEIKFYDLMHHQGNKTYERGLLFVFFVAIKNVINADIKVKHSIDKGICFELNNKINEEDILKIKEEMNKISSNMIPFERVVLNKEEATDYFKNNNMIDKVELLSYLNKDNLNFYKLGNLYDYFYGLMPLDTSYIKYFDISIIDDYNIVLLFPNIYTNGELRKYEHSDKVFDTFYDNYLFGKQNNVERIPELNKKISDNNIQELININEDNQNNKLIDIAKQIKDHNNVKMVLIGGPSSSGKTTTANKLGVCLKDINLIPKSISIDDYFVERENTPKDENGKYDFESIRALDLELFNDHLKRLLNKEEVLMPTFRFSDGKREYNNKMKLNDNEILIIEGLHALNDELTSSIDNNRKFKIYVSPFIALNIDNHNRISTTDLRLLRRMVRDNRTRGYDASKTLEMWKSVRKGEEKYVFPFKDKNDVIFDTAFIYEIGVLRTYLEPLLSSINIEDINYNEAIRLKELMENVLPIKGVDIPKNSLLREFIGNEDRSE